MAISLKDLQSPKKRASVFTLVGDGGMGKTTLASMFPAPVFIRTEDGTRSISEKKDVALFPVCLSVKDVMEQITVLLKEEHSFKTLVIDSITKFNGLAEKETIAADGKAKSLNQAGGGYGAGYSIVNEVHRSFRDLCARLCIEKNMNIVFIAHADTETVNLPDSEPFTRYCMRMNQKFISHYTDDVDLVGFIKLKVYTSGENEVKKAVSDGSRVVVCYPTPANVSKNRFGITKDLFFALNEFPFKEILA
jgi:phage nucleotide-binding protein